MNAKYALIILVCSGLVLSACSSNDAGNGAGGVTPVTPVTPAPANALAVISSQAADDDPLPIATQLESDIQAVFGDADNTPTDVVAGDTVQSVIDRASTI